MCFKAICAILLLSCCHTQEKQTPTQSIELFNHKVSLQLPLDWIDMGNKIFTDEPGYTTFCHLLGNPDTTFYLVSKLHSFKSNIEAIRKKPDMKSIIQWQSSYIRNTMPEVQVIDSNYINIHNHTFFYIDYLSSESKTRKIISFDDDKALIIDITAKKAIQVDFDQTASEILQSIRIE